jgi:tetratricopeptide (TPR) repeat protein
MNRRVRQVLYAVSAGLLYWVSSSLCVQPGNQRPPVQKKPSLQSEIDHCSLELSIDSHQPDTRFRRSQFYRLVPAFALEVKDLDQCIPEFERRYNDHNYLLVKENIRRSLQFCYADRGAAHRELGDLKWAIKDFDKAIYYGPTYSDYYLIRANLYEKVGQTAAAKNDRTKAAQLSTTSNSDEAFFEAIDRAEQVRSQSLALEDAYACYSEAIKLRPGTVLAYWLRADTLRKLGKYKLALADVKVLEGRQPKEPTWKDHERLLIRLRTFLHPSAADEGVSAAQEHEAISLGDTRNSDLKPLPVITDFISRHPGDIRGYRARAEALIERHDYPSAIKDLDRWLLVDSENAFAFKLRGSCFEALGKYDDAIRDYTSALDKVRSSITGALSTREGEEDLLFTRAACYSTIKQYAKAKQDYDELLRRGPENEEAYKYRGDCCFKLGDFKSALSDYSMAIKYDRESQSTIYAARAEAYKKLGMNQLAAEDIARAKSVERPTRKP